MIQDLGSRVTAVETITQNDASQLNGLTAALGQSNAQVQQIATQQAQDEASIAGVTQDMATRLAIDDQAISDLRNTASQQAAVISGLESQVAGLQSVTPGVTVLYNTSVPHETVTGAMAGAANWEGSRVLVIIDGSQFWLFHRDAQGLIWQDSSGGTI
jgi:hypothetical protein